MEYTVNYEYGSPIQWSDGIDLIMPNQYYLRQDYYTPVQYVSNYSCYKTLSYSKPEITKVIFNPPATIVYWSDKTKTVVKCDKQDEFSEEVGLAMCIAKKFLGNKSNFNNVIHKWIKKSKEK